MTLMTHVQCIIGQIFLCRSIIWSVLLSLGIWFPLEDPSSGPAFLKAWLPSEIYCQKQKTSSLQWWIFIQSDLSGCSHKNLRHFRRIPLAFYNSSALIFGISQKLHLTWRCAWLVNIELFNWGKKCIYLVEAMLCGDRQHCHDGDCWQFCKPPGLCHTVSIGWKRKVRREYFCNLDSEKWKMYNETERLHTTGLFHLFWAVFCWAIDIPRLRF